MHFWPLILLHESQDDGILDQWVGEQDVFHIFGIDVQAVSEHDEVFLTSLQIKMALLIKITEIASVIPAILEGGGSGFRIFPIAQGDIRPMHQYLLVLSDTNLHARQSLAYRIKDMIVVGGNRDNRRTLCGAITLQDTEAHVFPTLGQFGWQISPAADEEAEAIAKALMNCAEEDAPQSKWKKRGNAVKQFPLFLFVLAAYL